MDEISKFYNLKTKRDKYNLSICLEEISIKKELSLISIENTILKYIKKNILNCDYIYDIYITALSIGVKLSINSLLTINDALSKIIKKMQSIIAIEHLNKRKRLNSKEFKQLTSEEFLILIKDQIILLFPKRNRKQFLIKGLKARENYLKNENKTISKANLEKEYNIAMNIKNIKYNVLVSNINTKNVFIEDEDLKLKAGIKFSIMKTDKYLKIPYMHYKLIAFISSLLESYTLYFITTK